MLSQPPELVTALDAARRAAKICTAVYATLVEAANKSGREPVTIADYASQAVITARLTSAFPRDSLIGEEHAEDFERLLTHEQRVRVLDFVRMGLARPISESELKTHLRPPTTGARHWIVDPIDGTKGFLAKRSYAIAIALQDDLGLQLGILACPNLALDSPRTQTSSGILFYAVRGAGAYWQPLAGSEAQKMQVAPTRPDEPLLIATSVESEHNDQALFERIVAHLPSPDKQTLMLDGQGKYGLVAAGRVTSFLRLVPDPTYREKIWDHAAGTLIVQEAGGTVTDFDGKPLDFSQGRRLEHNRGIVASNGVIHNALLEAIAKVVH